MLELVKGWEIWVQSPGSNRHPVMWSLESKINTRLITRTDDYKSNMLERK
jgi:hypothetical protein